MFTELFLKVAWQLIERGFSPLLFRIRNCLCCVPISQRSHESRACFTHHDSSIQDCRCCMSHSCESLRQFLQILYCLSHRRNRTSIPAPIHCKLSMVITTFGRQAAVYGSCPVTNILVNKPG